MLRESAWKMEKLIFLPDHFLLLGATSRQHIFTPAAAVPAHGNHQIQFAVFPTLTEMVSSHPFRDISTNQLALFLDGLVCSSVGFFLQASKFQSFQPLCSPSPRGHSHFLLLPLLIICYFPNNFATSGF